ncbi:hypothetical protein WH52_07005 [Tenacibaculum holothuriorum]|uniref:Glycosyl transferase family 1 domain-containing protein n=1 Tax=Tenacibaculum holothuriorum TaxID=1635173 RepID=A0A1Y2PDD2_9FLAO|nr:glycosyltransferase family 4 protein [Tenacibaculum holothuriorum]OSY88494.1 hypothetical protein WH52_07005 [Tenacibaculum holothuriorum]
MSPNKKLHILFLCGWYPSRVLPNNGDFIQRHAETVSLQHNVSILHIISDINNTKNIEYTTEVINHVNTHIAYIKPSSNPVIKGYRFYIAFKKLLAKIGKFDIIHLNKLYPFGLFTFLLKQPYIISEHWTGYYKSHSSNISFFERFVSKKIIKKASYVCPVSNELKKSMEQLRFKGNYNIVGNVVDTSVFKPLTRKENDTFTIIHISNMNDKHKNVSGIISAFSKLEFKSKLVLVGENSSKYMSYANKLNCTNNIEFIEHIPHYKVVEYLQSSDLYISFSNYETWGIVMIEALACGTPVISTDTGILNEIDKNNSFEIIKTNDVKGLVNTISSFKNNRNINKNETHDFIAKNFSPKTIAEQFINLYKNSLN